MGVLGDLLTGGYKWAAGEIRTPDGKMWKTSAAMSADNQPITKEVALSISAWFAAHRILSTQFMKAPLKLYKRLKSGGREEVDSPLSRALRMKPNFAQNAIMFKQMFFSNAFWGGKAVAVIDVNPINQAFSLIPLHPSRTELKQDEDSGEIYFVYRGKAAKPEVFFSDEVLHFPGIVTIDGVRGIDILTHAATQIGISDKQYKHMAHQLKNRGMPIGKFKSPSVLSDEQKANIKAEYMEMIAGPENSGKIMVVSGDADFEPLSMSNQQMELAAMAKFAIQDTSRFTGVPPAMLFDNSESTWNNNPEQNRFFLEYGLDPWLVAFEMCCNTQLLSDRDQKNYFFEFDRSAFSVMDLEKTSKALLDGKYGGWINGDEARSTLNLPPMENGLGKIYWRPGNMVPADAPYVAGSENQQPQPAGQKRAETAPKEPKNGQKIQKNEGKEAENEVFEPILRLSFHRFLTKFEKDLARLKEKENFEENLASYETEKKSMIRSDLKAVILPFLFTKSNDLELANEKASLLSLFLYEYAKDKLRASKTCDAESLLKHFLSLTEQQEGE